MISAGQFVAAIERARIELSQGALESPAHDLPAYNRLVGRFQGMGEAIEIIKTIAQEEDE